MRLSVGILMLLLAELVSAGGSSYDVRVHELTRSNDGGYVLFLSFDDSPRQGVIVGQQLQIKLSYAHGWYRTRARFLTQEKFDEAIQLLRSQVNQEGARFGLFGAGLCRPDRVGDVYLIDALDINRERDRLVVYGFCKYK